MMRRSKILYDNSVKPNFPALKEMCGQQGVASSRMGIFGLAKLLSKEVPEAIQEQNLFDLMGSFTFVFDFISFFLCLGQKEDCN